MATHKPRQRRNLKLENLESRELMAVDIQLAGDVLTITGRDYDHPSWGDDTIEVRETTLVTKNSVHERIVATVRATHSGKTLLQKSFDAKSVQRMLINGMRGDDTIYNRTSLPSDIRGGNGDDLLQGGSDQDTLTGGNGADTLKGGNGSDILKGGNGRDKIYGQSGNDRLYGGGGTDLLYGGSGKDGLFGGGGNSVDYLWGQGGNDRFLNHTADTQSDSSDQASDEAEIDFRNGDLLTMNNEWKFEDGQWTYVVTGYDPGSWTEAEIIKVDEGLAIAHQQSPKLLKYFEDFSHDDTMQDGTELVFTRQGDHFTKSIFTDGRKPSKVPGGGAGGLNFGGGRIMLPDAAFPDDNYLVQIVLHEIGHNWDDESPFWTSFKSVSGWTGDVQAHLANTESPGTYVPSAVYFNEGHDGWWHKSSATFARNYGMDNPSEDFATTFAAYFMFGAGKTYQGAGAISNINAIGDKAEVLDDLFAVL